MKITIDDGRQENRRRDTRRDISGAPLNDGERRRVWAAQRNATGVGDSRVAVIEFEEADYASGQVPRTLDWASDRNVLGTFVNRMEINFYRSADDEDGYRREGRWRRAQINVSGENLKKDGTPGVKLQSVQFPTRTWAKIGVWTEADIDPDIDPDSYWGRKQRDRVGQDRSDYVPDPLPEWVAAIVDRVHPQTGELPFQYTTAHLFGDFADQAWTPDVALTVQGPGVLQGAGA